ncbi:MAG TPA: ABC transporter permease, partial [Gemmatimonadaceae bacterium]
MSREPRWRRYLRFFGRDVNADIADELRFHLQQRIAQYESEGLTRADAERAARERLGDLASVEQELRQHDEALARRGRWFERLAVLGTDLRFMLRALRRSPSFALIAIVTLAVGIGLSTAVYTVADSILLRPLPVREQDKLVLLWGETRVGRFGDLPLDYPEARQFARQTRALQQVAFVTYEGAWPVPVRLHDQLVRMRRALVSGNFFDVLGARPLLGRTLKPGDDIVGAAPVIVLSYAGWQRAFSGDSSIVGQRFQNQLDGVTYTIVGVMPPGIEYPAATDFWSAVVPARTPPGTDSTIAGLRLLGRLSPGASLSVARQEATAMFRSLRVYSRFPDVRGVAEPLLGVVLGDTRPAILIFLIATALILLITCVNVGTLLLVRGLVRAREIAVRAALGASRARIIGQLGLENALLALGAGILGVLLAAATVRLFLAFAPTAVPRLDEVSSNAQALVAGIAVTSLTMLLFGLA